MDMLGRGVARCCRAAGALDDPKAPDEIFLRYPWFVAECASELTRKAAAKTVPFVSSTSKRASGIAKLAVATAAPLESRRPIIESIVEVVGVDARRRVHRCGR